MRISKTPNFFIPLVFMLFLSACEREAIPPETEIVLPVATVNTDQEDQRLAVFFDEIFERDVSESPMFQAYLGRKTEDYGRWDDFSDADAQLENQQSEASLQRLRTEFNYDALGDAAKMSYRIFEYNRERDLRNFEWRFHNYAISPMNDVASDLPTFLQNIHKIETRQDAVDYISRLAGIQTVMQQVVEQLRQGESIGVVPPMMKPCSILQELQYNGVLFRGTHFLTGHTL